MFWNTITYADLEGIVGADDSNLIASALGGISEHEQNSLHGILGGAFNVEVITSSSVKGDVDGKGYVIITPEQVSDQNCLFLYRISQQYGLQKIGLIKGNDDLERRIQDLYNSQKQHFTFQNQVRQEVTVRNNAVFVQALDYLFTDAGIMALLTDNSEAKLQKIGIALKKTLIASDHAHAEHAYQGVLEQEGLFKSSFFTIFPLTIAYRALKRLITTTYSGVDFEPVLRRMSLYCLQQNILVEQRNLSPSKIKEILEKGYGSAQDYRDVLHERAHVYGDFLQVSYPQIEGCRRKLLSAYEREIFLHLNKR